MGEPLDYVASGTIMENEEVQYHEGDNTGQAYAALEVATAVTSFGVMNDASKTSSVVHTISIPDSSNSPEASAPYVGNMAMPHSYDKRDSMDESPPEWKEPHVRRITEHGVRPADFGQDLADASTDASTSGAHDKQLQSDFDEFEFHLEDGSTVPARVLHAPTTSLPTLPPKSRKPKLQALTLPEQADPQLASPEESGHEESHHGSPPGTHGPMTQRKPPRAYSRLKTRLQDPPPMTPAVTDQIPYNRRRFSIYNNTDQPLPTSRGPLTSRKSFNRVASFVVTTPSRLKSMASFLFSPRNAMPVLPIEEEVDPLDDESIPQYKRWKKIRNKWVHWIQWFSLIVLCAMLACSVRLQMLRRVVWKNLLLWQWLALALVVASGRLISGGAVKLLVVLIERHYLLKRRVLYFVYGLRHSVKNCIWLALVISTWKAVFRHSTDTHTVPIITKVLWCLFTASGLWLIKVLCVKTCANSFHRAAYFDRIQDCLFHQYVLETISQPKIRQDHDEWPGSFDEGHTTQKEIRAPATISQDEDKQGVNSVHVPTKNGRSSFLSPQDQGKTPHDTHGFPSNSRSSRAPCDSHGRYLPPRPVTTDFGSQALLERRREQEHAINVGNTYVPISCQKAISPDAGTALEGFDYDQRPQYDANGANFPSPNCRKRVSFSVAGATNGKTLTPKAPGIAQDKLQELTSETVPAWTLRRLMKIVRTHNMTTYSSMLSADWEIDSEVEAKAAAKQIFYNMADPGEKHLMLKNFMEFLPEDKATKAYALFDVTEAGKITKKALVKWVVNVYKERKALSLTLSDNRTVVAKLHRVLDVLMLAVSLTLCLLIMGVNTQKLLVAFSSILLPSVFIFGNAARSTFESLIFLFIMHPFDVGDRIAVDGVSLIVEEMNILNTVFLSGSNEKIYYPNSVLATKPLSNFYRSPDQWDAIDFQIHSTTPVEKIGILKDCMTKYIESLPQFWYPTFRIICKDIEDSNRMKMSLWMQHHLNFQEAGERWQRRSNMIFHMKKVMEDLQIGFHMPRMEITVTGVPLLDVPTTRL